MGLFENCIVENSMEIVNCKLLLFYAIFTE
jgi:hypothetical protein